MLRRVVKGDKVSISANTFNQVIDATNAYLRKPSFGNEANKHKSEYLIKNKTGKKLPIYSVVMITDIENDFPDSADETGNLNFLIGMKIVFKALIPDKSSLFFDKICITQEPLAPDAVGVGILDSMSKCVYKIKEKDNYTPNLPSFFRAEDQNTDNLFLSNYGGMEVVYSSNHDKKDEIGYGVVNLGNVKKQFYFPVDLTWKSGGDSTSSYTARIYDIVLNGKIIKSDVDIALGNNPYRRPQDYNVTKATLGLAFCSGTEENILIAWANEYPLLGDAEIIP